MVPLSEAHFLGIHSSMTQREACAVGVVDPVIHIQHGSWEWMLNFPPLWVCSPSSLVNSRCRINDTLGQQKPLWPPSRAGWAHLPAHQDSWFQLVVWRWERHSSCLGFRVFIWEMECLITWPLLSILTHINANDSMILCTEAQVLMKWFWDWSHYARLVAGRVSPARTQEGLLSTLEMNWPQRHACWQSKRL